MKLKLMVLLLMTYAGCTSAQLVVVTPETQVVTIAWEHDGSDTTGAVDVLLRFNIYLSHNDGEVAFVGFVSVDTLEYTLLLPDTTGKYTLGVSALDVAHNESIIHWSTDSTAQFNGWYLLFDSIPPSVPFGLRRIR